MKYSTTVIKLFCLLSFLTFSYHGFAQDKTDSVSFKSIDPGHKYFPADQYFQQPAYKKPRPFSFLTNIPGDLLQIAKSPFQKQNLRPLITIAGTTALLLHFDQTIINGVGSTSRKIGLEPEAEFDALQIHNKSLFKLPDNLNSGFYQLGEGTTTMGIAGGFFIYGKITHDNRALQTASDLTEAFLSMGITIQALKRITGRQAPFMATVPGGRWQPFPSFSKFQRYTVNYDAFPSGHLATMMATITVLAENYPEKKWIRPVGYLLTGLTGWSMMNNRVHWASDFPLGLAIGYLSGKIAYNRHHKKELMRELLPLQ
jgi:membrane-associated phospholipid phosphatase